jgi:hypothetical protein
MKNINPFTFFYCIFLFIGISSSNAQKQVGLKTVEISGERKINIELIEQTAFNLLNAVSEIERIQFNSELKEILINELNKEEAITNTFKGIQSISLLSPSDSAFILFNWNMPLDDGSYKFECGILHRRKADKQFSFFKDTIYSSTKEVEHITTNPNYWIPNLFYKIIETNTQYSKYYTLLYWNGNDLLTNIKGIDVLWFDRSNQARFGAPIFKSANGKTKSRVQFEYGGQNKMKLQYNADLNRIQYDHLSPPAPDQINTTSLIGIYEYYGPDLSFDSYNWNGKAWIHHSDIDLDEGKKKSAGDFKYKKEIIQEQAPMYKPGKN